MQSRPPENAPAERLPTHRIDVIGGTSERSLGRSPALPRTPGNAPSRAERASDKRESVSLCKMDRVRTPLLVLLG